MLWLKKPSLQTFRGAPSFFKINEFIFTQIPLLLFVLFRTPHTQLMSKVMLIFIVFKKKYYHCISAECKLIFNMFNFKDDDADED